MLMSAADCHTQGPLAIFISSEVIMLSAAVCVLVSSLLVQLFSMHAKSNYTHTMTEQLTQCQHAAASQ